MRSMLTAFSALIIVGNLVPAAERPNVVWIFVDDMSANFRCYGETTIETPNVDRMAAEGTRFSRTFVTAPVCSTCRSALITGMYQTSIGAHHHRSGRGAIKIHLPEPVIPAPVLFQQAGYYTTITSWPVPGNARARGKTDYNFEWDAAMYDGNDWRGRASDQPFFAQIELPGGKLRGNNGTLAPRVVKALGSLTSPDDVTLPPYYPDDTVIREDWAAYLDSCRETDRVVGEIMTRLEEDGLLENTVVFFMTDHGISHARGKQFLYDEGIHVPFVVRGPGINTGVVRDDLVEHIDMTATSLALAGIDVPDWMQGRDLFAEDYQPREAIFTARDRCDETVDHLRCVRTERFKYIRNFLPLRPHLQPNAYKDNKAIYQRMRELHASGELAELPEQLLFAAERAPEELYDLESDPFETHNLAGDPAYADVLADLRGRLEHWMEETNDHGRTPETPAMYDSDMAVYLDGLRGRRPERLAEIEANIELMQRWSAAGR